MFLYVIQIWDGRDTLLNTQIIMKTYRQHDPLHVVVVVTQSDDIMNSNHNNQETIISLLKSFTRVIAVAFLSLLLPLSFLLLARLSTARYYRSLADDQTLVFLKNETALILSILVSLITLSALVNILTGGRISYDYLISERLRLHGAWFLLFMMQVCLSLGIYGMIDAEVEGVRGGGLLVVERRVCLLLGLHECMVLWCRSVVKPVVDKTVSALTQLEWAEKGVMAVALGNLWWRRLRNEAEVLVVVPWVGLEDVVGLFLYYLMVVIGIVRVVRGGAWVLTKIYGHRNKV